MNLHHLKMEVKDEDPTGNESLNQGKTEHLLFSDSQEGEEEVMKSGIHITPFPRVRLAWHPYSSSCRGSKHD
jgi:hypothetical protein